MFIEGIVLFIQGIGERGDIIERMNSTPRLATGKPLARLENHEKCVEAVYNAGNGATKIWTLFVCLVLQLTRILLHIVEFHLIRAPYGVIKAVRFAF